MSTRPARVPPRVFASCIASFPPLAAKRRETLAPGIRPVVAAMLHILRNPEERSVLIGGCAKMPWNTDEKVPLSRLWLRLRRGEGAARSWHRAGHSLGRHSRRLGLPGLRHTQVGFRDGRD